jgi:hypothetical protein
VCRRSHAIHGFLHFAVAAVTAFNTVGRGAEEAVVQEGQGLLIDYAALACIQAWISAMA